MRISSKQARELGITLPREPKKRGMNKTEAAYAELLEGSRLGGNLIWWGYEAIKLRLADKTYYTPDFAILYRDGTLQFIEVKGFWRDDARVKIKVAAEMFPFRFKAVKKCGLSWHEETIPGRRGALEAL